MWATEDECVKSPCFSGQADKKRIFGGEVWSI